MSTTDKRSAQKPSRSPRSQERSPRAYQIERDCDDDFQSETEPTVDHDDDQGADSADRLNTLFGQPEDEAVAAADTARTNALDGAQFDAHGAWRATLDELALQLHTPDFDTWIRDAQLMGYEDGEFLIGLPNAYARDWVQKRLRTYVKRTLRSIVGRSIEVTFRVCTTPVQDDAYLAEMPLYGAESVAAASDRRAAVPAASRDAAAGPETPAASQDERTTKRVGASSFSSRSAMTSHSSQLNAHHSFASFVVGNHNRLAHAAAQAVADQPGHRFNPLFIYGGVGLGKTHLLHAIGNLAQEHGFQTLYCSSEQFTNELISAIRSQSTEEFRNKYRQVDILLIDDIQFIGGKESTQEEFFHTFNHLQASGGQVVLSSDRPPKALATLEERLRSRFEGGLQTDISKPDFETRVAILQTKSDRMALDISQDVLMLVAERVDSNIRELEGALNQLSLQAHLVNSALTPTLALTILDNLAPSRTPCTPSTVLELVADHYQLSVDDLKGRRRTSQIAGARQVAMYLLREENSLSLPAIGELLGGRDHTTVRHGVDKVTKLIAADETMRQDVFGLCERIYMPFIG